MCSYIVRKAALTGSAKGPNGWMRIDTANVYFDHPYHAPLEHALGGAAERGSRARSPPALGRGGMIGQRQGGSRVRPTISKLSRTTILDRHHDGHQDAVTLPAQ
jgi:hypothetical protein